MAGLGGKGNVFGKTNADKEEQGFTKKKNLGYTVIKTPTNGQNEDVVANGGENMLENTVATPEVPSGLDVTPAEEMPLGGEPASKSILAKDLVIIGDIETKGDIEILGTHTGAVKAAGVVSISGTVNGDITAKTIFLQGCEVSSSQIVAEEDVVVAQEANVKGNITCRSVRIDASVEGDITASGTCKIVSTANVTGNISAGALGIEEGAKLAGNVQIKF